MRASAAWRQRCPRVCLATSRRWQTGWQNSQFGLAKVCGRPARMAAASMTGLMHSRSERRRPKATGSAARREPPQRRAATWCRRRARRGASDTGHFLNRRANLTRAASATPWCSRNNSTRSNRRTRTGSTKTALRQLPPNRATRGESDGNGRHCKWRIGMCRARRPRQAAPAATRTVSRTTGGRKKWLTIVHRSDGSVSVL